ncbi:MULTISPECIES: 5'-methylthioadenosine/S-adenosylhomocysteine nucleosidase [unclassified Brevundimonas]|uniref:5'-methylthioadenosine/S-adenosylhomocysteine nucleosidase n=1 Tax=unclassified Brevundimonas TaxID=2622653 RepID=UPI0025C3B6CA|nr:MULTISPECIES: 5'-methylthioadenosine/S-adenosylhomocysteine nucleosidase [unclassified Brevundimonas]
MRARVERIGDVAVLPVMAAPAEYRDQLQARIRPLITGIGPVEGAVSLSAELARREAMGDMPDLVVVLGSSGSPTLEHAAVYQVTSVDDRDMDASPLGFPKGITPLLDMPAVLPLPCRLEGVPTATLSTGANVVSGEAYQALHADMVDMETFAYLRATQTFCVPLMALRGVSDGKVELTKLEDWTSTLDQVDANLAIAWDRLVAALESGGLSALMPALEQQAVSGLDPAATPVTDSHS